uniref:Uncharacterized protein n=1 Tax=Photinus pyralis TaxID=7054 RepID=A0A1Y1LCF3_PHOPY
MKHGKVDLNRHHKIRAIGQDLDRLVPARGHLRNVLRLLNQNHRDRAEVHAHVPRQSTLELFTRHLDRDRIRKHRIGPAPRLPIDLDPGPKLLIGRGPTHKSRIGHDPARKSRIVLDPGQMPQECLTVPAPELRVDHVWVQTDQDRVPGDLNGRDHIAREHRVGRGRARVHHIGPDPDRVRVRGSRNDLGRVLEVPIDRSQDHVLALANQSQDPVRDPVLPDPDPALADLDPGRPNREEVRVRARESPVPCHGQDLGRARHDQDPVRDRSQGRDLVAGVAHGPALAAVPVRGRDLRGRPKREGKFCRTPKMRMGRLVRLSE